MALFSGGHNSLCIPNVSTIKSGNIAMATTAVLHSAGRMNDHDQSDKGINHNKEIGITTAANDNRTDPATIANAINDELVLLAYLNIALNTPMRAMAQTAPDPSAAETGLST